MTAENLIGLLEEMMEIKIRHYVPFQNKLNPDVARMLREKRDEDTQRLRDIRTELITFLDS
ncbi:MAG TPA: hypothetical protein VHI52_17280 [Verrucomicrobiae bacterium]|nr:hypothetical protein [Verrucomicrobiae bacterium]